MISVEKFHIQSTHIMPYIFSRMHIHDTHNTINISKEIHIQPSMSIGDKRHRDGRTVEGMEVLQQTNGDYLT